MQESRAIHLIPTRPVTIDATPDGHRWFPIIRRLADGSLLIHVQTGHDLAFSPVIRLRSFDLGARWQQEPANVPRCALCVQFDDGEMLELDNYGTYDPATNADSVGLAAWSKPGIIGDNPRLGRYRVHNSPMFRTPAWEWINGNPTMPWWPLWEDLHAVKPFHNELFSRVHLNGVFFSDGLNLGGDRLLALANGYYGGEPQKKNITCAFESRDRGANWEQVGMVTDLANSPWATNEAAITRLKDGRLYAVLRTDAPIFSPLLHSWSDNEGRTWSSPLPLHLIDEPDHQPGLAWPRLLRLESGALLLGYGRPVKHVAIDPTGTGTQWQRRLDLHTHELETQAFLGVPEHRRLRGVVGHLNDLFLDRYHDSGDYLGLVSIGAEDVLVIYDVQDYVEDWNARPFSGLRMVRLHVPANGITSLS